MEDGAGISPSGRSNANAFQQVVAMFDHHVGHRLWQARVEDYNRSPWWRKILLTFFGLRPD